MTFAELISAYAVAARTNLGGPGQREAALSGPVADLIRGVGEELSLEVSAHNEVSVGVGSGGQDFVRPDFGVRVNGVMTGHIELKAPGVSLDPTGYSPRTHNGRQWQRLKELPNLLHTNGIQWRLWRYGELVTSERTLHVKNLTSFRGDTVDYQVELDRMLSDFLSWEPVPITGVSKLVDTLGPLTRLLREEVMDVLKDESKAPERSRKPISALHKEWKRVLFPGATTKQFADGMAQTVVFALLLAVSEGLEVKTTPLGTIADRMDEQYGVMAQTLSLLADHTKNTPVQTAIETITRTLAAVEWERMASGKSDLYLHLYEHFLRSYDPELKELSGSYYTPVEIVDAMVEWSDQAVRQHLGRPEGLSDEKTQVIDPAMGTGTFPLSVLRKVRRDANVGRGKGFEAEAVESMVERLYGIEIQSAPFSVAELRISQAIKEAGAAVPADGLNLFIGDTLEDPRATAAKDLSYKASLIAQQRIEANRVKLDENIQVIIGNPPYDDRAGGRGGWIENGVDPNTGAPPLAAFKAKGNGSHERHLYNLYSYFWRWATWKAFESTASQQVEGADQGVVCFITASGFLNSPGFRGMREYLRRKCTAGWIIDVTPEDRMPPPGNAVFAIKTAVTIALFVRGPEVDESVPATIRYRAVNGTKAEKFAQLPEITLDGEGWEDASTEWQASFKTNHEAEWLSYPSLRDLHPWYSSGVSANRTWVYSPSKEVLHYRLNEVIAESDLEEKDRLFKWSRDANLDKVKEPLPGIINKNGESDTYQDTGKPFKDELAMADPKFVPMAWRSFDRQWLIADSRLIHDCRRPLWHGRRVPGQVFMAEQHSHYPKAGSGMAFSAAIPNNDFFNGRGGRIYPLMHPDGSPNLSVGLAEALEERLGPLGDPRTVAAYIAGISGHPGYVQRFSASLMTPGNRVPLTADRELWDRAVALGEKVLWCHTYGVAGRWEGAEKVTSRGDDIALPEYSKSMGAALPQGAPSYDETAHVLTVGAGQWTGVLPAVRNYTVGGENILNNWVGWRSSSPGGKKSSPLDSITAHRWEREWSTELDELLCTLTRLVCLEAEQDELLGMIVDGPLISREELTEAGVQWPPANTSAKPEMPKFYAPQHGR